MTTNADGGLDQIITATRHLFLDFDGPICSIFAGLTSATVASQLRDLITSHGITPPAETAATSDPFEVFAWAATISPSLAADVEAAMTELEVAAVPTAEPTIVPEGARPAVSAGRAPSDRGLTCVAPDVDACAGDVLRLPRLLAGKVLLTPGDRYLDLHIMDLAYQIPILDLDRRSMSLSSGHRR
jgi:hypothetical protein